MSSILNNPGAMIEASESIVTELKSIRDNVIAAQESNVDRSKIQTDISESVELIKGFVSGAQFNGQNLLDESGSVSILSSLDRSDSGVTAAKIDVAKADLTTRASVTATLAASDAGGATYASTGLDALLTQQGQMVDPSQVLLLRLVQMRTRSISMSKMVLTLQSLQPRLNKLR